MAAVSPAQPEPRITVSCVSVIRFPTSILDASARPPTHTGPDSHQRRTHQPRPFFHQLHHHLPKQRIRPRQGVSCDRLAAWNGTTFVPVSSTENSGTEQVSFKASAADFIVLAPTGRGTTGGRTTAFAGASHRVTGNAVLDSVFFTPEGQSPLGTGVLAPRWLPARSR